MGIKNKIDSTYIRVELDASRVENGELAHLNICRKGYGDKETGEKRIWSVEIPAGIVNNDNVFGTHRIELSSNLGDTNIKIDGKHLGRANLNPLGQGGDFIAFPVLGEVGVYLEKGQKARFSDFVISNYRSPSGKIGKVASLDTCGVGLFVMTDPSIHTMPRLRRALTIHQANTSGSEPGSRLCSDWLQLSWISQEHVFRQQATNGPFPPQANL